MRTLDDWLDDYAQSHRNPVNKALHWICVPLIVFAVLGALAALPAPAPLAAGGWAGVAALLALGYWMRLSWRLGLGMLPVLGAFALALRALAAAGPPLWQSCLAIFVIAWIGCQRGFQVQGGVEAVGEATTSAVVTSILLIVIVDSAFAVVLHYIN